ncbi:Tigger transposable element-derived protein 6, partial [Dictyocoela muelleri]
MLGCSPLGEWLNPLLIGKSLNPRVFNNLDLSQYNVFYRANKTSWLTKSIFEEYISLLNEKLILQSRKILILVDNFSGHMVENKSNIELLFFPPNCTSVVQPLDMGIIKAFKVKIKQKITNFKVYHALHSNLDHKTQIKKIKILNVVLWIESSIKLISEDTIKNCWNKTGLFRGVDPLITNISCEEEIIEEENDGMDVYFEDVISFKTFEN